jgi:hypothetical protein
MLRDTGRCIARQSSAFAQNPDRAWQGMTMWVVGVFVRAVALIVSMTLPGVASAQSLLTEPASRANGIFFSASGDYRAINMPTYALGAHAIDISTFGDAGSLNTFNPRVTGAGGQATLGIVLSPGTLPAALGSNVRLSVSGGYFDADSRQNSASEAPFPAWVLLDGTVTFGCGCITTSLTTQVSGWTVGLNAASDVKLGQFLWTPSIELVFAGTRNRQSLVQASPTETYSASTRVTWDDAGVKFGLGVTAPVTAMSELSLGGTLAVLYRRAEFGGTDFLDVAGTDISTAINVSANTWTLVPGLLAQLTLRPAPQARIGMFGGVEWDTRAPMIVAPNFTDFFLFQGNPASLGFTTQTSYRVGGSFTYAFNP